MLIYIDKINNNQAPDRVSIIRHYRLLWSIVCSAISSRGGRAEKPRQQQHISLEGFLRYSRVHTALQQQRKRARPRNTSSILRLSQVRRRRPICRENAIPRTLSFSLFRNIYTGERAQEKEYRGIAGRGRELRHVLEFSPEEF